MGVSRILQRLTAPGEHVGFLLPNSTITAAAIIGALLRARVPAMLNYTAGAGALNHAVDAAGLKIIVSSRQFLDKARLTELPTQVAGARWVFLEDLRSSLTLSDKLWTLCHLLAPARAALMQRPDDSALILFTSGSEGTPKAVWCTPIAASWRISNRSAPWPISRRRISLCRRCRCYMPSA